MKGLLRQFAPYRKAITGAIGIGISLATLYWGDNKYVAIAVAVASAYGIYAVPNDQQAKADGP